MQTSKQFLYILNKQQTVIVIKVRMKSIFSLFFLNLKSIHFFISCVKKDALFKLSALY